MKVSQGNPPMFPIQKEPYLSQGSSQRESNTLRKKTDKKTESFQEQVLNKSYHLNLYLLFKIKTPKNARVDSPNFNQLWHTLTML